jgi:hypothetical protein
MRTAFPVSHFSKTGNGTPKRLTIQFKSKGGVAVAIGGSGFHSQLRKK